jgi:uncharacterized protein (TIGR02597 family)
MNIPPKFTAFLAGSALVCSASLSSLSALTTDPLGFVSYDVNANADRRIGVPLNQAPSFVGSVASVTSGTVTVSTTVPDVTTEAHYLWVTSGSLLGKWYEVTGSDSSTVTVAEDLETNGLIAADTFKVVPFWTLDTLFPNGGDIPASSDVFNPVGYLLTNDVSSVGTNLIAGSVFIYHDGSQGPAGWYDVDNLGSGTVGSTVITPESFVTIRNETISTVSVTFSGVVPRHSVSNNILSRAAGPQDNQITNPYPAPLALGSSDLVTDGAMRASSDVFNPLDVLLIYETVPNQKNPVADKVVIYHDGAQGPAGWYDVDDLGGGTIDAHELPAGGALVVRRAVGADEVLTWSPSLPYVLD